MTIIKIMIINGILALFPILIYEYFYIYMQNLKKEKIEILLNFSLLISLYLTMYIKNYIPEIFQFSGLILPVLISYFVKKPKTAILISIVIGEYIIRDLNYNIITTIIYFSLLFIIYIIYNRTNKTQNFLLKSYITLTSLMIIINEIPPVIKNRNLILDSAISVIIFIFIIYIINIMLKESSNIMSLHSNLKEFEKEKSIRLSLFKITHEIKNPIAVVKGYLDMFDSNNKEKSEKYVNVMKNEIDRTLNLLTDFMEFTKIKVEKKENNFNELIDDVKEVLIPFFIAKNISYYFEVEENINIKIDYLRMKQVILNIIKNAVESCEKDTGHVSTTIFTDTDSLYIYVKDNGTGMTKETLDKILTPFYTTKEKGTGLGVSLSKEIIESHGGNLSYTSDIGKGTVCKIALPKN
ncbi:MAG: HAMP domain-containing histidine kinase [Bacilli bacterium]|nr:HAMP domain-containing histidine kinase [Bacilli bacterium]